MVKFAICNDPSKKTSGQRFWTGLCDSLEQHPDFNATQAKVIFFNISAPFREVLKAKLKGQKVVMRLDGIYHEKLSSAAINEVETVWLRPLLRLIFIISGPSNWSSLLMNFLRHNRKLLFKVWFADFVIYQSEFSRSLWLRYFPRKRSAVILNGAPFQGREKIPDTTEPIYLVTTYDSWRPAKRLHDLIQFVRWQNQSLGSKVSLLILGFEPGSRPATLTPEDVAWINRGEDITLLPKFSAYTPEIAATLRAQHLYITFSFCDNCPNAVIEAMSFGLPVLALSSGGIPEIVRDGGELAAQATAPYFCSFDHSFEYPEFSYSEVAAKLEKIRAAYPAYCAKVKDRFKTELDMPKVAAKYLDVLQREF